MSLNFNIYTKKRRWKLFLFALAVLIVAGSLWYTNLLVRKFAKDERNNVKIWVNAIQRKAKLVKYTDEFFDQIRTEEKRRAEILAGAYNILGQEDNSINLSFSIDIIGKNTTIPVIITDDNREITNSVNYIFKTLNDSLFTPDIRKEFLDYPPIVINYLENKNLYLYYKKSILFVELRNVLDDIIQSFLSEVVTNSASVPVIVTDSSRRNILTFGNIDSLKMQDSVFVKRILETMNYENDPIILDLPEQGIVDIFYMDSALLTQIKYYPIIQFFIIGLFLLIAYFLFSIARKSEQNQVWVGMSKETAHQLGTPLSALIAWVELLKLKYKNDENIPEMEKDLERLENVTERFSKIGSSANLENIDIIKIVYDSIEYFKKRTSKKVNFFINPEKETKIFVPLNKLLFEWVIENLCKNAVDAIGGNGTIKINIFEEGKKIILDFSDTGKGISKKHFKSVFNPGFTSKKRGWGLGLSLSERIIQMYHSGKIYVRSSALEQGTTFRIVLKKKK